jgi:capsular polysaccharide biosynthesis protein
MEPNRRPDSFEVSDYTGVLRRRWWVVLTLACLGVAAAFAYVEVAPKTYTATAAVYVSPTAADQNNQVAGSRTNGAVNLDTEAQVVRSAVVATIAAHLMHSPLTAWKLSNEISVTVPPNSQILDIACNAPSATGAAECANAFAEAYLQNRSANATSWVNAQVNALQSKVSALQKTVTSLKTKISSLPAKSATRLSDEAQIASDEGQLHSYTAHIAALTEAGANNSGGHIITTAGRPGKPSSPKKSLVLPSGLAAGLVLGLIVAFAWDRRDKHVRSAQDAERFLDLPVLLSLPGKSPGRQIALASPRSVVGRAFNELGHTVAATLGEGNHVVIVVGASPGPGGSVVAANMAATLARTHPEVVLVCADLNGSVAPGLTGVEDGPGLTEILSGEAAVRDVVRSPAAIPGLWVITPGTEAELAGYYIQHDRAKALASQLRREARYVIIEVQAVENGADTFAFAEFADAAVVVAEAPRTRQEEAVECVQRLQRLRTPVIGVAVIPAIGRRVAVRPPRPAHPALPDWRTEGEADGASAVREEPPAMSATSAGRPSKRARPARSEEDYHGPADRVHRG